MAAVHAAANAVPRCQRELLEVLGAGTLDDAELTFWIAPLRSDGSGPPLASGAALEPLFARSPLVPRRAKWRITAIRSVVVGPARFNQELAVQGLEVRRPLRGIRPTAANRVGDLNRGRPTFVRGDKHGGRHYYFQRLSQSFPDVWIDRGLEGPDLSRYTIRDATGGIGAQPDAASRRCDGLVALASIVSKTVRELWMDVFNAYWRARVPGLRPTAGYPTDSLRFRLAIEEVAAGEEHAIPRGGGGSSKAGAVRTAEAMRGKH